MCKCKVSKNVSVSFRCDDMSISRQFRDSFIDYRLSGEWISNMAVLLFKALHGTAAPYLAADFQLVATNDPLSAAIVGSQQIKDELMSW